MIVNYFAEKSLFYTTIKNYFEYIKDGVSHSLADLKFINVKQRDIQVLELALKIISNRIVEFLDLEEIQDIVIAHEKHIKKTISYKPVYFREDEKNDILSAIAQIPDLAMTDKKKLIYELNLENYLTVEMLEEKATEIEETHAEIKSKKKFAPETIKIEIVYYDLELESYKKSAQFLSSNITFDFFNPTDLKMKGIDAKIIKLEPQLNNSNKLIQQYGERILLLIDGITVAKIGMAACIFQKESFVNKKLDELRDIIAYFNSKMHNLYDFVSFMQSKEAKTKFSTEHIQQINHIGNELLKAYLHFLKNSYIQRPMGILDLVTKLKVIYQALTESVDRIR